jgi:hypothetical protein
MKRLVIGSLALGLALACSPTFAEEGANAASVTCEMKFSLKGWSAFYKTAKGEGTITCTNGESAAVKIHTKGGGLTFGKSELVDGTGKFSEARNLEEVLGSYARAEAHAGAVKSSAAQAMTKGEISLAISGTGRGWDLGVAFGSFTIERGGGAE